MTSQNEEVRCTYHYDPMDRLIGLKSAGQDDLQRFYCKSRLATEVQGQTQFSIMQHGDRLLAQQQRLGDTVEADLLVTDQQRSVLYTVSQSTRPPIKYSPYGYRSAESGLTSLLGFNGERQDAITGRYLLGNGHRAFNLVLMRFNSPDHLSPFDEGGVNAYSYCSGDPVNRSDPSGESWFSMTTKKLHGLWLSYTNKSLGKFDLAAATTSYVKTSRDLPRARRVDDAWRYPELSEEMSGRAAVSANKRVFSEIEVGTLVEPGLAYIKDHSKKHIIIMDDLRRTVSDAVITPWKTDSVLSPARAKLKSEYLSIKLHGKSLIKQKAEAEAALIEIKAREIRMGAYFK
ncbi:RHS repeat-associated core domain-containing protein [Pseudomonas sp. PCH199]|uniref:RHS repeat-associated core domain-containing protein n=1 Tax=unclassified Pseudomonas TaxID=196821 RepID=UPI000BDDC703|nr:MULTISPECIES: RHS repeat-associated core domain-containing protein [unclassified Pseudomonas]MCW8274698.1 RHS repeat-associated core domain-containing protein [Pseudomonas sp. PCH199]PAM85363.1 hypothetical protein CES87_02465 [Pseudomonas sp. ERMR1:02]